MFISACQNASADQNFPFVFTWDIVNDKRPVEYARNVLVQRALEYQTMSRLWFIDKDMGIPSNVFEMLQTDGDIVCGQAYNFCHMNDERPFPTMKLCAFEYDPRIYAFSSTSPVGKEKVRDVDACGAATMIVRRRVLEDPLMHLDPHYLGLDNRIHNLLYEMDDEPPSLFRCLYKPNGAVLRSEDVDFTWRAKQAGYSIKAHLGARFSHWKTVDMDQIVRMVERVVAEYAADPEFHKHRREAKEALNGQVRQVAHQAV
jgi:hypothetical protein